MPLTKLFQKRNSLKEMAAVNLANEEIEKLTLSTEVPNTMEAPKMQSETSLSEDIVFDSTKEITDSLVQSEDYSNKYEYIETDGADHAASGGDGRTELRRRSAPLEKSAISKIRSTSCKDGKPKSDVPISRRRKCVSESQTYDSECEEECNAQKLKSNALENMIGRCINRLIKESIITAVKSVNVDDLYEEIMENISIRGHSESSESAESHHSIELKWPDNATEFLELEDGSLFGITGLQREVDSLVEEENSKLNSESDTKKPETMSLDSYSADCEESISLNSTDLDFRVADSTLPTLKSPELKSHTESQTVSDNRSEFKNKSVGEKLLENQNSCTDDGLRADCEESDNFCPVISESKRTVEPSELKETEEASSRVSKDEVSLKQTDNTRLTCEQDKLPNSVSLENITSDTSNTTIQNFEEVTDSEIKKDILEEESNLIVMSPENDSLLLPSAALIHRESKDSVLDLGENLPQQKLPQEEEKKLNWKVGYLHVKLPHKARNKSKLKAWKKRCVSIQPDEFVNDPKNPSLMISVYSAESGSARKHGASFWKSISCQKAVVYRSGSRSHRYAFTISDDNKVVIHLAADSEAASQEWMAAIRSILWPPSPVMQLEKMLNGKEFEISIIDNDFAFRAGLLGMYGYLTITGKKLILVHPQQGYVIQEWYLNTVDKFELMQQSRIEDVHKVLAMTTCSDSSTGKGEILMFCTEAIAMLQAVASTIHQILTEHIEQEGSKYEKELAEMADWLVPATSQNSDDNASPEEYYKVPPRQVKSLLDIPNFIFDKQLSPAASISCKAEENMETSLATTKTNPTRASQDSGISAGNISEDFLNCSSTSFVVGGRTFPGKSSDSELSDSYTPPRSPQVKTKHEIAEKKNDDASVQVT